VIAQGARLARIFRHPVKGLGCEDLARARLSPAGALTGDRAWALLVADAPDTDAWQPRRNFVQVAAGPALARLRAETVAQGVRLCHPDRDDFVLRETGDGAALAAWIGDLWPEGRPRPARLVRAPGHGMTDMAAAYVSLGNLASLREVSARAGRDLDPRRFRVNLWVEGLAPWAERGWIGRAITLGGATLRGAEPIGRCRAPEANPATGTRDVDVLRLLRAGWGHTEFGVYMDVTGAGEVATGDALALR